MTHTYQRIYIEKSQQSVCSERKTNNNQKTTTPRFQRNQQRNKRKKGLVETGSEKVKEVETNQSTEG